MPAKKPTYQELNQELDEIMAALQSPDIDIDEATKAYERGIVVVKELEEYIKTMQNKVSKIKVDLTRPDA